MREKIRNWLDVRIGLNDLIRTQLAEYRVPKNINVFNALGTIAFVGYLIQAITGMFLMIYYIPHSDHAFRSVQDIMTVAPYGWLFRQMHVIGSNLLIAAVILHMVTIFLMGNYKRPRELTWIGGALMLLLTFTFGLSGYLLPWTQLSYWATTIVTSIPTAFPVVGEYISRLFRGGDYVSGITLTRFFALHVSILPPLFLILMAVHVALIRRIGLSATPFGKSDEEKRPLTEFRKKTHPDGYLYYPYLVQKQALMVIGYFIVMFAFMTFAPTFFFPEATTVPADPLRTPETIRPEWYFLAPYQMLKLIPNKFLGISMLIAVAFLFVFWPFLDTQKEKNIFRRPVLRWVFISLMIAWIILMWWGRR